MTNYKMGKYNFPKTKTMKTTKRRNMKYAGKPTKYQRTQQNKELLILFTFCIPFILTTAFLDSTETLYDTVDKVSAVTVNAEEEETGELTLPVLDTLPYVWKDGATKIMKISYYSELDSCHYPTSEGCLTASGKIAEVGMIATNLFPFGTKIEIDGIEYTVEDRISKRYNNRLDIFTGYGKRANTKAIKEGIKNLPVKIIN